MTTPNIEELAETYADACADVREHLGANAGVDETEFYWVGMKAARATLFAGLQSQAERIAMLESLNELAVKQAETLVKQRDTLRAGRATLAQQELPQKARPDFMAGYDAGMADAKRMAQQAKPVAYQHVFANGRSLSYSSDNSGFPAKCDALKVEPLYTAAPAPQAQSILASAVLALNTLWNKSSVKDSAIADQLAVCRVLAESDDDMELTDAQILTIWEETYVQRGWTGIEFARAIERAHGIGVKQ